MKNARKIRKSALLSDRLRRQRLTHPVEDSRDYLELAAMLQPFSPVHATRPGDPPRLVGRALFDDSTLNYRLRARHELVKGRFLRGRIGYVLADDLECYAIAFRRPISRSTEVQQAVLSAIQSCGGLTARQLKEETGYLTRQIAPALKRLQEAFLVYEDQVSNDWDRGWFDFATEWPDVQLDRGSWEQAASRVLMRFLRSHAFATFEQIRDWSGFPIRLARKLVDLMEGEGRTLRISVDELGEGWVPARSFGGTPPSAETTSSVFMLHKADPLVLSHASELKRRYGKLEVLQYLLIDGEFTGAVVGHWRIRAHDVEDVVLTMPESEARKRKDDIIRQIARIYHPQGGRILRFMGEALIY